MTSSKDTDKSLTKEEFWEALQKDYSKRPKLSDKWTFEADDILSLHGIDVEEELATILAEEISKEIKNANK